jgi:hypothetical protein
MIDLQKSLIPLFYLRICYFAYFIKCHLLNKSFVGIFKYIIDLDGMSDTFENIRFSKSNVNKWFISEGKALKERSHKQFGT